ncbi:MAG: hypothetical protein WBA74_08745, partial [Cyclobacteriaceae bacterium]
MKLTQRITHIAALLLLFVYSGCETTDNAIEIDGIKTTDINHILPIPVFSRDLGINDLFTEDDLRFESDDFETLTFVFPSDTVVRFLGELIHLKNPEPTTLEVDLSSLLGDMNAINLQNDGVFTSDSFPNLLDLRLPTTPESISLPNSEFLAGVELPLFEIFLNDSIDWFRLIDGQIEVSLFNRFQADVEVAYELIADGEVQFSETVEISPNSRISKVYEALELDANSSLTLKKEGTVL